MLQHFCGAQHGTWNIVCELMYLIKSLFHPFIFSLTTSDPIRIWVPGCVLGSALILPFYWHNVLGNHSLILVSSSVEWR